MKTLLAVALVVAPPAFAEAAEGLWLPAVFGDHMVLQREQPLPVWGRAAPGSELEVRLAGQQHEATAAADGSWRVTLAPLPAGGPWELVVEAGGEERRFSDVLVGEVWLASGQSNMEWRLDRSLDAEIEIRRSGDPELRFLTAERATALRPQDDVEAGEGWQLSAPGTSPGFSAVAYFFARRLRRELGVPVGVLHTSWGGTVAEAWTSREALERLGGFESGLDALRGSAGRSVEALEAEYRAAVAAREASLSERDAGTSDGQPIWAAPDLDDSGWKPVSLPGPWESGELPDFDGVVWFRREVTLPAAQAGRALILELGPIDDADVTWLNGTRLGSTGVYDTPRVYAVPEDVARQGRNVIAVRAYDSGGNGGFTGEAAALRLSGSGSDPVPLAGEWRYRIGLDLDDLPPLPPNPAGPNRPTVLYNAMLRPLAPYALRGFLWYQGESNAGRAYQYRALFQTLIRDWRATWGGAERPFYFVQLANFNARQPEPGPSAWAELREAQAMALALPATGMAVTIDIGEADDIHPRNKVEVGNRLARHALNGVYGEPVADSGPVLESWAVAGGRIQLRFDAVAGGLEAKGGALHGFEIAGPDQAFRWAEARITAEDSVEIWSDAVPQPVAVRYGWADNPRVTLYDGAGLPASPFRTDAWPGITVSGN